MTKKEPNSNGASDAGSNEETQPSPSSSHEVIYDAMMRSGGEPFGAPWGFGLASLTVRVVRRFKIKGFFGFETMEKLKPKNKRNKFTRAGASRFWGPYSKK
jgi:hypothetical protein